MFDSVLVANRGEIAVRVIRTLARLGVQSIAVYSDADADAPHVRLADVAVRLGPAPAADSYLAPDLVLEAARATGAQAIHPGYGFLSENAAFARACAAAGVVFIGPPPEATERLGDKVTAKEVAVAAGVPVLPGLQRPGLTDAEIVAFAEEDAGRLPLMIKAAAGGGGRGMRVVRTLADLPDALAAARREALSGFGDDALLAERYVERARHIEVQLLADAHGTVVHLGERECSLQRRHQKVVEESPSPVVSAGLREQLGAASVALAHAAGYVGAGTAEFLVSADDLDEWFFLEVNARLQVEHPVTELVTGLDLVEQQLRVAAGERLSFAQSDVQLRGHAIEVRVCAEDPAHDFLPSTGTLVGYREPIGEGVRVDSGVTVGSQVTPYYDSLIAKVIASGEDRAEALERLDHALGDLRLLGLPTNAGFLRRLLRVPAVREGALDTGLIERGAADLLPGDDEAQAAAVAVAAAATLRHYEEAGSDPWDALVGFRLAGPVPLDWQLRGAEDDDPRSVVVEGPPASARVRAGDRERDVRMHASSPGRVSVTEDGRTRVWDHAEHDGELWVAAGPDAFRFTLVEPVVQGSATAAEGSLEAPMPGTVLEVRVSAGDAVTEGVVLIVIESMKMELTLIAPADATVADVLVAVGDSVKQGQPLVELEATP
ncbi:MAG: biotin/lipoyl-binding protein [Conexibacter sp.]|nr:biotin/lipoyl-binding protein [Conexibacter sp.]